MSKEAKVAFKISAGIVGAILLIMLLISWVGVFFNNYFRWVSTFLK